MGRKKAQGNKNIPHQSAQSRQSNRVKKIPETEGNGQDNKKTSKWRFWETRDRWKKLFKYISGGLVMGFMSILIAWLGYRYMVERDREEDYKEVEMSIGRIPIQSDVVTNVYYLCPIDDIGSDSIPGILPFGMNNLSKYTVNLFSVDIGRDLEAVEAMPNVDLQQGGIKIKAKKRFEPGRFIPLGDSDNVDGEAGRYQYKYDDIQGCEINRIRVDHLLPQKPFDFFSIFRIRSNAFIRENSFSVAQSEVEKLTLIKDLFFFEIRSHFDNQKIPYRAHIQFVVVNARSMDDFLSFVRSINYTPISNDKSDLGESKYSVIVCPEYFVSKESGGWTVGRDNLMAYRMEMKDKKLFGSPRIMVYYPNGEVFKEIKLDAKRYEKNRKELEKK